MRLNVMFVRSAILALSLTVPVATAQAGPITPIISGAGDFWQTGLLDVFNQVGSWSGGTVAVAPHPLWEQTHLGTSGADWISYAYTGYGQTTLAPFAQGNTDHVMSVRESITAMAGSFLTITVWADDTAIVRLTPSGASGPGDTIIDHTVWNNTICETYAIGCRPWNSGSYSRTFGVNDAGDYDLWFDTYQIGTGTTTTRNPFGLMYEGSISEVPEPGAMILFGTGLLGLASAFRRRIKK